MKSPIGMTDTMTIDVVPCISALGDAFLAPREWALQRIADSKAFWNAAAAPSTPK